MELLLTCHVIVEPLFMNSIVCVIISIINLAMIGVLHFVLFLCSSKYINIGDRTFHN